MDKEFIPYEEALALKELGFDERQFAFYEDKTLKLPANNTMYTSNSKMYHKNIISAPLYQQAFRWFREKYRLYSYIQNVGIGYEYVIDFDNEYEQIDGATRLTYEEAQLACLRKLIEIVKENSPK